MYYTYVFRSKKDHKLYTGATDDLRKRFHEHNKDMVRSTKERGPFQLVYYEACLNKSDAFRRERYLKSGYGKRYLKSRLKRFLSLAGFTLIEGIIATGIIATAMIVGLSLAYSNLTAAQANSDRVIASHLAREGLEVIRNIRDSNWLRRDANIDKDTGTNGIQFYEWSDFYPGAPKPVSSTVFSLLNGTPVDENSCYYDSTTSAWGCGNYFDILFDLNSTSYKYSLKQISQLSTNKNVFTCMTDPGQVSCRVQKNGSLYFQSDSQTGANTPYYRRIILNPICWDGTTERVDDDANMLCGFENGTQKGERIGVLVTSDVVWSRGNKLLEVKVKERLYDWRTSS